MAAHDKSFVYSRQKNYQQKSKINNALVYPYNIDTIGEYFDVPSISARALFPASANVTSDLLLHEKRLHTAYANVYQTYRLRFGPISTLEFSRLNSNIYKNIFPEVVTNIEYINNILDNTPTTLSDIVQENHGLALYDAVYLDGDGKYQRALAEDSEKATVAGVVTKISSNHVFTLMTTGKFSYNTMNHDDTSVLYLSDTAPGKIVHYSEITNMIYVPVAIYTGDSIVVNVQQGSIGSPLAPYTIDNSEFDFYTLDELDAVVDQIKVGVQ